MILCLSSASLKCLNTTQRRLNELDTRLFTMNSLTVEAFLNVFYLYFLYKRSTKYLK